MAKKIINVKYHPDAIHSIDADDLNQITADIKELVGPEYIVIFTPFDFQEIPDEGLFGTVENMLNTLKEEGRDKDIVKLAELISEFVPAEHISEGEPDVNPESKYHQCDADPSVTDELDNLQGENCKVIDCDA